MERVDKPIKVSVDRLVRQPTTSIRGEAGRTGGIVLCVVVAPDRRGSVEPSRFGPGWTKRENHSFNGDPRTKQHVPRGGNSPVPAEKSALPGLYFFAPTSTGL